MRWLLLIGALVLAGCAAPDPVGTPALWQPALGTTWQWQLDGPIDTSANVTVYDVDGVETTAAQVGALHAAGRKVICYVDAGGYENYRPDAGSFPASVLGNSNGWPGQRWLDIRQISVLEPIMAARFDTCHRKGFDAVEADEVDGYANDTGFPLAYNDQIAYNTLIANEAHGRGLSVGLKNDLDQIADLLSTFDWALDEECFYYSECSKLVPFIKAAKPVFEVEYSLPVNKFCPEANALNFNSMKKHLTLDAYRVPCR
jgi:hypothetical protein